MSQPELAGGRLVLYVQAGGGLQVVGLDPATGRTVWHDGASPGGVTPGEPPFLGVAGSTVTFFSPVNDRLGTAELVAVDATTGRRRWHSPGQNLFADWPAPCADDPSEICTTVFERTQTAAVRIRASDGTLAAGVLISQSDDGRSVGPDLFDSGVGSRGAEMLTAATGASVLWTRRLSSLFPTPGASTLYGWDFDRVTASGLFVGWVGAAPLSMTATSATADLSRTMTAGFRIDNGTTVWRDAGTRYACNVSLPCPTSPTAAETGPLYQPPTMGLRLRATGIAHSSRSAVSYSPGADVVVEGFDMATGKTRWSYDAGSDSSLIRGLTPPLLGSYLAVLPSPGGGRVALNLARGARGPVPAGATAWCHSLVIYRTTVKWYEGKNSPPSYERAGQEAINPCQPSGASAPVPPTVPAWAGTVADGLTAWSEPSEVAAAPASS